MEMDVEAYIAHYGTLHKSGRYPWGSGEKTLSEQRTFLGTIEMMRKEHGMSEPEIARGFGMTTTQLRNLKTIAKEADKQAKIDMALRLKDKGYSNVEGAKHMGIPESTFRTLIKPGELDKASVTKATVDMLKEQVAEKHYLDVGTGTELHMNITRKKLDTALTALQEEGYKVDSVKVDQLVGKNHQTRMKVLSAPGTGYAEVMRNADNIKSVAAYSEDGGRSYDRMQPPLSISSKRVAVRYGDEGGRATDGVIYVRPGVKDTNLGKASYAQVRIAVDGTHYLKGMAMYKDDLPDGVDLMFNTNKSRSTTGNKLDAMKPMKDDPENPFGSAVRQIGVMGPGGKKKLTSVMNIVNEEGDWEKWSKSLSSQFLSKQSPALAKEQLALAFERKKAELDLIMGLTNPGIKKRMLKAYADDADSSAVHLKAASLPRQGTHIILPIDSMKESEVYAPNYDDGELVVLIRHPHAGTFEIPELRVNNRQPEAKKLLGNARDAIGIHSKVAEKLSGADFDGDTVLVIPNGSRKVKTSPTLEGLRNFDPQRSFPGYDGMHVMTAEQKGMEMGQISNLITDMTIMRAPMNEVARAVRHSMVVIDAEKHKLDYTRSAIDNGIPALQKKYQGRAGGGASTIVSQAKSPVRVAERKMRIDPATGKKVYEYSGETYTKTTVSKRTGKVTTKEVLKPNRDKSTRLAEAEDAHTLSSGTAIEKVYADHSNRMKDLANTARKEMLATKTIPYSPAAKERYKEQVRTLEADLNLALRNSPLERQALVIANANIRKKLEAEPNMDPAELKKLKFRELENARIRTGAFKKPIKITPEQWDAIQAGAITAHKLDQILSNTDLEKIKELATPKVHVLMTPENKNRALAMLRQGYNRAQVASHLGVSVSTLKRSLSEDT